jgi:triphosphoribosyl-dephospho-CoA synthase
MGATSPQAITEKARQLACLPDRNAESTGLRVARRYKVSGARGEAQAGFPAIITAGLPTLYLSRRLGENEAVARLNALLAIMARLDDTCLLRRDGLAALNRAQAGAAAILAAGGTGDA